MNTFIQDFYYALRQIRKEPCFFGIIILTLALGIGATSAIFSVINTVFFHSLPFKGQDRIVRLGELRIDSRGKVNEWIRTSYLNFLEWKAQAQIFEGITVLDTNIVHLTSNAAEPERIVISPVSQDYFIVVGVNPSLGRPFREEEFSPGGTPPLVISYALWMRQFQGKQDLLGQPVEINGRGHTIVGIMPADYRLFWEERPIEAWTPMTSEYAQMPRKARNLACLARLKAWISLERAEADLGTISQRLAAQFPETNQDWIGRAGLVQGPTLETLQEKALWILLAAVGLVLGIASVNVANLLLSRMADREREISIRAALGASRSRILRQLLTESWVLATAGGAAGLLLAFWGVHLMNLFCAESNLFWPVIRIDWRVLIFTALLTLLVGTLFGLAPAWHASRMHLQESLRGSSRSATRKKSQQRLKGLLVVSEVTLSLVLLIGSFLLLKSFYNLLQVPLGFRTENLLTTAISLSKTQYPRKEQQLNYFQQALSRVKSLPGVESAALTSSLPLGGNEHLTDFITDGNLQQPPDADFKSFVMGGFLQNSPNAPKICWWRTVSPDYFKAMGIRLLAGRSFSEGDNDKGLPVVIVSSALARRHWGNENPIGKQVFMEGAHRTVVGVVDDVKHRNPDFPPLLEAYLCAYQLSLPDMYLVVHTNQNPWNLLRVMKKELYGIDSNQPVSNLQTMEMVLLRRLSMRGFLMILTGFFAGTALLLASLGLYGVMANSVTERTQEMGIRMAIGASRRDILTLVLRQGMAHVMPGLALGLMTAWGLTRLMTSQLFGVNPTDTAVFTLVPILLTMVSLLACYLPAHRATQVDPLVALRYE